MQLKAQNMVAQVEEDLQRHQQPVLVAVLYMVVVVEVQAAAGQLPLQQHYLLREVVVVYTQLVVVELLDQTVQLHLTAARAALVRLVTLP